MLELDAPALRSRLLTALRICLREAAYFFVSPSAQFKMIVGDFAATEVSCASARMCCPSALTSKTSPSANVIKD